jgi:hypothetical protein
MSDQPIDTVAEKSSFSTAANLRKQLLQRSATAPAAVIIIQLRGLARGYFGYDIAK